MLARSHCIPELIDVRDGFIDIPGLDTDEVFTTINEICCNWFSSCIICNFFYELKSYHCHYRVLMHIILRHFINHMCRFCLFSFCIPIWIVHVYVQKNIIYITIIDYFFCYYYEDDENECLPVTCMLEISASRLVLLNLIWSHNNGRSRSSDCYLALWNKKEMKNWRAREAMIYIALRLVSAARQRGDEWGSHANRWRQHLYEPMLKRPTELAPKPANRASQVSSIVL